MSKADGGDRGPIEITPAMAAYIRAKRQARGIKQRDMAEMVGLSPGGYAHLESGRSVTSIALPKVLEVLEIDAGSIAGISVGNSPQEALAAALKPLTSIPEAAISPCESPIANTNGWRLSQPLGRWASSEVLMTKHIDGPQDWAGGDELLIWHSDARVELCRGVSDRHGTLTVLRGAQACQLASAHVTKLERLIGGIVE